MRVLGGRSRAAHINWPNRKRPLGEPPLCVRAPILNKLGPELGPKNNERGGSHRPSLRRGPPLAPLRANFD